MLDRKAILESEDRPTETIHVPEWGGDVFVRTMSARERDIFDSSMVEESKGDFTTNLKNIRAKLCVYCVVDENGDRVFGDKDADLLGDKSAAAVERIFDAAQRLNGLRPEDVKELAKNSGEGQPESSASG